MDVSEPDRGAPADTEAAGRTLGIRDIDWSQALYIVGSGICMGAADVVPGVSGGTMAIALGIYQRLLAAIASINLHSVRMLLKFQFLKLLGHVHFRFLGSLLIGIFTGVVLMLKVVRLPHLLETQTSLVYAVFFGFVLASSLVLAKRLPAWTMGRGIVLVLGIAAGFAIVNLVPVETPQSPAFIFLCGVISICAMLLPGISGSFVLLILGKYAYIIGAVEKLLRFDWSQLGVLVPFALGCAFGIALFARFLGWLLYKWHDPVISALIGLLLGSLWRIWPYQRLQTVVVLDKPRVISAAPYWPASFELRVFSLMLVGLCVVLVIENVARRRQAIASASGSPPGNQLV